MSWIAVGFLWWALTLLSSVRKYWTFQTLRRGYWLAFAGSYIKCCTGSTVDANMTVGVKVATSRTCCADSIYLNGGTKRTFVAGLAWLNVKEAISANSASLTSCIPMLTSWACKTLFAIVEGLFNRAHALFCGIWICCQRWTRRCGANQHAFVIRWVENCWRGARKTYLLCLNIVRINGAGIARAVSFNRRWCRA